MALTIIAFQRISTRRRQYSVIRGFLNDHCPGDSFNETWSKRENTRHSLNSPPIIGAIFHSFGFILDGQSTASKHWNWFRNKM